MKLILITLVALVALVVGSMVACGGGDEAGSNPFRKVADSFQYTPTPRPTPTPTPTPRPTPTPTPAPIPQIIKSKTTAVGYNKGVGFLTYDYTVEVRISVVNAGAPGVIEAMATVWWDGDSKTRRDSFYLTAGQEKDFVLEFIEVGSSDKWTWSADARVVR